MSCPHRDAHGRQCLLGSVHVGDGHLYRDPIRCPVTRVTCRWTTCTEGCVRVGVSPVARPTEPYPRPATPETQ